MKTPTPDPDRKPGHRYSPGRPGQRRVLLAPQPHETTEQQTDAVRSQEDESDVGVCPLGAAYATLQSYVKSRGVVLEFSLPVETDRCYGLCWEKRMPVKKVSVRRAGKQASLPAFPVVEVLDVLYGGRTRQEDKP